MKTLRHTLETRALLRFTGGLKRHGGSLYGLRKLDPILREFLGCSGIMVPFRKGRRVLYADVLKRRIISQRYLKHSYAAFRGLGIVKKNVLEESLFILFVTFAVSVLHPFVYIVLTNLNEPYPAYHYWLDIYVYSPSALRNWIGIFMVWLVIVFSFLLGLIVFNKTWVGTREAFRAWKQQRNLRDSSASQADLENSDTGGSNDG